MRVLIVGSGLTGSLAAFMLSQQTNCSLRISVWEKAQAAGGRTFTYQDPFSQRDPRCHVNMGAQYVSRTKDDRHGSVEYSRLKDKMYDELLTNGILAPLCGVMEGLNLDHMRSIHMNYVAPKGFNSIPEYFLNKATVEVNMNHNLTEINVNQADMDSGLLPISCMCSHFNKPSHFDVVVLTMPAPDLLQVDGNLFESLNKDVLSKLASVRYAPRYALGLFYDKQVPKTTWTYKYFAPNSNMDDDGDVIVRYASWGDISECRQGSLLVHSGVEFATKHKNNGEEIVKKTMLKAMNSLIPDLPPPSHSKLILWRYARANRMPAYHDTPGCLVLSRDPMLVATGDGLSDSNFEGCLKAAWTAVNTITSHINKKEELQK